MTLEEKAAALDRQGVVDLLVSHETLRTSNREQASRIADLQRQLDWYKQQLFGSKSERRIGDTDSRQLTLGEADSLFAEAEKLPAETTVAEHSRRRRPAAADEDDHSGFRFDPSVPVEEIVLDPPAGSEGEVIGEKVTYRLAQRPTYLVLKYVRPVLKRPDGDIVSAPAPAGVLGRSVADASLLASMVIDKLRYHLPLYRQHQRLQAAGVKLARSTLTNWMHRTADLLEPVYEAQLLSILSSQVLTMDETPIKAGRRDRGKMRTGYFWPLYGDRREVAFPFSQTRAGSVVRNLLSCYCGTLISDGYRVYERFATETADVEHAQCWAHTRRYFVQAESAEPELAARALDLIGGLFAIEKEIARKHLSPEKAQERRGSQSKPIVDEFFGWLKSTLVDQVLLPRNPFTKAAEYALARETELRVFLGNPAVPLDTNHIEREIRPIAVGRKNWLFCWTELGAEYVGILQSLIATCRLHAIDPHVYLVDVLQRIDSHPARDVAALTPRLWKERFAADPLRSDLDKIVNNAAR